MLRPRRISVYVYRELLTPTMLALGGTAIPSQMQGRDFSPLLRGESPEWRQEWFYEHVYNTRPPRRPIAKSEGVRTTRWKYVRYIEHDPPYEQLFDLKHAGNLLNNLSDLLFGNFAILESK